MHKLLQWNIWNQEDIDNIVSELQRIDADVVCVQELTVTEKDKSRLDKIKKIYPYCFFDIAQDFVDGTLQGNAIFSKYEIVGSISRFVQLPSSDIGDFSKEGRIYIEADIKIDSKVLHVGTTHLSFTCNKDTPQKDLEVANLLGYVKMHRKNFILTGDLNCDNNSKYVTKLSHLLVHYETNPTWTTKSFLYKGFSADTLSFCFDHVFASKDINVLSVETIETTFSDHLPILMIFN